MTHTYQAYLEDPVDARATEMDVWAGPIALVSAGFDLSFDWGGGGQVSTVGDLCLLVEGFTTGRLFRDPATLGLATSWLVPPGLPAPRTGIGLGLHRWQVGGHELVGHAGAWGVRAFVEPATGVVAASSVGRRDDCAWFARLFDLVGEG
jgi:D-alanyl-D-alanine carboxypeptidase